MLPFARVTVIGLGLIGSSIARGLRAYAPTVRVTGYDADPAVREVAVRIDLCDDVADTAGTAVIDAVFARQDRLLILLQAIEQGRVPRSAVDAVRREQLTASRQAAVPGPTILKLGLTFIDGGFLNLEFSKSWPRGNHRKH